MASPILGMDSIPQASTIPRANSKAWLIPTDFVPMVNSLADPVAEKKIPYSTAAVRRCRQTLMAQKTREQEMMNRKMRKEKIPLSNLRTAEHVPHSDRASAVAAHPHLRFRPVLTLLSELFSLALSQPAATHLSPATGSLHLPHCCAARWQR
jgi:hypothetical protein